MRQSDLAAAVGIDQRTISNYETGKTNPDSDALIRLANFFGVSIDYLVCRIPIDYSDTNGRDALIEKIKKELDRLK
ncbi:MAG: helix-turn-helix transcriptional regulator [Clostridia bacterium]|nr:helix-turn-helix transcriptional regulator [Clostridia bacterium]